MKAQPKAQQDGKKPSQEPPAATAKAPSAPAVQNAPQLVAKAQALSPQEMRQLMEEKQEATGELGEESPADDAPTEADIESEHIALDPQPSNRWQKATRLEMWWRNYFAMPLQHAKWRFVAADCIATLVAMVQFSLSLPQEHRNHPQMLKACRVQLVRLVAYKRLIGGQHTSYVDCWSKAANGQSDPAWMREADKTAAATVKKFQFCTTRHRQRPFSYFANTDTRQRQCYEKHTGGKQ